MDHRTQQNRLTDRCKEGRTVAVHDLSHLLTVHSSHKIGSVVNYVDSDLSHARDFGVGSVL